jgi:hypothetical protein
MRGSGMSCSNECDWVQTKIPDSISPLVARGTTCRSGASWDSNSTNSVSVRSSVTVEGGEAGRLRNRQVKGTAVTAARKMLTTIHRGKRFRFGMFFTLRLSPRYNGDDNTAGAQTERRGLAGPGRDLLAARPPRPLLLVFSNSVAGWFTAW